MERASGGGKGWHSMAWHGWPELIPVLRARGLHEPFDFPVSAIFLQSSCTASRELLEHSQSFPRDRDGHFCLHTTVYLQANSSALQERSNPPQTCPEASQDLRQAPADQVEQYATQHTAASSTSNDSS